MAEYDNNLQVIVSKVVSDNQKAPTLNVQVDINGRKYSAGVWMWRRKDGSNVTDKNGNAQYIGKLKEWDSENPGKERQQGAASGGQAPPGPADRAFQAAHSKMKDEFDDDIPF
jgi:hypothetical protein